MRDEQKKLFSGSADDSDDLELDNIIDSDALQSMMDDFYRLTRIGIGILDTKGTVLVAKGWQDICVKFHRCNPETLKNCTESDVYLSQKIPFGTFRQYRCKNNLWDLMTPIVLGSRHIGNVCLGQFFYEDEVPDLDVFREQARRYGFDEKAYLQALDAVPRWSHETVQAVMAFYSKLAAMISKLSYSTIKISRANAQKDTLLRQLKESEERFALCMDATNDGIWDMDLPTGACYFSPALYRMFGYEPDGFPANFDTWKKLVDSDDLDRVMPLFDSCVSGLSETFSIEYRVRTPAGKTVWILSRGKCISRDHTGKAVRLAGTIVDISSQKQYEEKISALLEEKNLILKEIHHRIKNNMYTVYSFLSMQAGMQDDPACAAVLNDAAGRIQSMMVLYNKLYRAENYTTMSVRQVIPALADEIFANFPNSASVNFSREIGDFELDVKKMQAVSLVINELMTNCMKYAFSGNDHGKLLLRLVLENGTVILTVADNGPGLPPDIALEDTRNFGFLLVNALAQQLSATVSLDRSEGTKISLAFSS